MGKLTNLVLGAVGGVLGAIVGGPWGAFVGFSIGYGLGTIIDPFVPDIPSPGEPTMNDLEMMSNQEGLPLPDILGTAKTTGNLLFYGNNRMTEITENVDSGGGASGGGGGGDEEVVTGQRYFLSWALAFCLGPVDTLYTVWADDEVVWSGELERTVATKGQVNIILMTGDRDKVSGFEDENGLVSPGEEFFEGRNSMADEGIIGVMTFYFGTADQEPDDLLGNLMQEEGAFDPADGYSDLDYHIPYRRQCYAYLHNCYIGSYNRCPTIKVVLRKAPECSFDT